MGRIGIPYYTVRKGRGFWEPTPKMRALGFFNVPCGKDGPEAWKVAEEWNRRWQATRTGAAPSPALAAADNLSPAKAEELTVYPPRSIGEGFKRYRRTAEWSKKGKRSREDWFRGWQRIKPIFGDVDPRTVTLEDISAWREAIERSVSLREAHRAVKIWRALWKVLAANQYCVRDADPSLGVRNSAAKGRTATWTEGEVVLLVKQAWRMGFRGLGAALAVMWDTQMSPVDVRTLKAGQRARDAVGATYFTTRREKTDVPVGAILSRRATVVLDAYLAELGVEPLPDAPLFRTRGAAPSARGGRPWVPQPFTKDSFAEEFRTVRTSLFGALERRQMQDMRRSGAVEAIAGDTTAEKLSRAMGNTLATSNALFETYVPIELAPLRAVTEARRKGRAKRRDGNK